MTKEPHCYLIEVQKSATVAKPQPVPVSVFAYYDTGIIDV